MSLTPHAAIRKDRRAKTPELQHRHFAFIANTIADIEDDYVREEAAIRFSYTLRHTNPNFDVGRFLAACEPQ